MADTSGTIALTGLDGVLRTLEQLPPEVVSKSGGPVKRALRKGARVLLQEAALNLARATDNLSTDSEENTGLLLSALVATRGKAPTGGNGERYLVRVKRLNYQRPGPATTTLASANLLEYGSEKQPAEPWLRPAFAAKAVTAIQTVEKELVADLDRVVRRLARQNGVR